VKNMIAEPCRLPDPFPNDLLARPDAKSLFFGLGGLLTVARHDRHDDAAEIVSQALDLGVFYIDTSALYGNGASELNIGTVMRERRGEVFLASKSHDYTYDGTMALIRQSLRRHQTDYVDLYQHHFLGELGQFE